MSVRWFFFRRRYWDGDIKTKERARNIYTKKNIRLATKLREANTQQIERNDTEANDKNDTKTDWKKKLFLKEF